MYGYVMLKQPLFLLLSTTSHIFKLEIIKVLRYLMKMKVVNQQKMNTYFKVSPKS
jgi:hypothetical protein